MRLQSTLAYLFLVFSPAHSTGVLQVSSLSKRGVRITPLWRVYKPMIPRLLMAMSNGWSIAICRAVVGCRSKLHASSESVILLPVRRSIHRVVVHSSNVTAFDIWVADNQGRWERVKEIKSVKQKVIDVRLNRAVPTTGVKIRINRTTDDAALRQKNTVRRGMWVSYRGISAHRRRSPK